MSVPQLGCDLSIKSGFAEGGTAIGTGAGFSLGDAQVRVVLENRSNLERPIGEGAMADAGEVDIKVFLAGL